MQCEQGLDTAKIVHIESELIRIVHTECALPEIRFEFAFNHFNRWFEAGFTADCIIFMLLRV